MRDKKKRRKLGLKQASLTDIEITPAAQTGVFFSSTPSQRPDVDPLEELSAVSDVKDSAALIADDTALDALFAAAGVWRANDLANVQSDIYPTGFSALDKKLPGGGWPVAGLTELLSAQHGVGELRLLMPGLARLAARKTGWIVWIAPPYLPNAPALMQWGIAPDRVLLIHPRCPADAAWAAEQALGSGTCVAMLLWAHDLESAHDLSAGRRKRRLSMQQFGRRLQLSAASHQCWAITLRDSNAHHQPSAAMLRLMIESKDGHRDLHIVKVRGGQPGVIADFDRGIDVDAMMVAAQDAI